MNNAKHTFDTSQNYVLSRLLDKRPIDRPHTFAYYTIMSLVATAVCFWFPLLWCAVTQPTLTARSAGLSIPFLWDFPLYPMQLILIPLLLIHVLRERRIISSILVEYFNGPARGENRPEAEKHCTELYSRWNPLIVPGSAVIAVGLTIVWCHWQLNQGQVTWHTYGSVGGSLHFNFIGWYAAIVLVGLWWFLIACTTLRAALHWFFFYQVASLTHVRVAPFHPDGCGGLEMISRTTKLYQLLALAVGINLLGNYARDVFVMQKDLTTSLNTFMFLGYVLCCAMAFVLPLMPFTKLMRKSRKETLDGITERYHVLWESAALKIKQKELSEVNYTEIRSLRDLYLLAKQIPVWPYDLKTLRSFVSYVIFPLVGMVVSALIKIGLENRLAR